MGGKAAKASRVAGGGGSPESSGRLRDRRDQGSGLSQLLLLGRTGESRGGGGGGGESRAPGSPAAPYSRRVALVREMHALVRDGDADRAMAVLRSLRQDLGMESTSLDDVLYKYASFRNIVDPITHDLIISLARDIQCPKTEDDALRAFEKLCRQLIYHLSPHSQLRRQSTRRRKPQASAKPALCLEPDGGTLPLSGVPLGSPGHRRELERVASFLQGGSPHLRGLNSVELSFAELTDDGLRLLLPGLAALPNLASLALNGNRLTRAVLRDLAESLKEPRSFPSLSWVDLGNNVDIFSLPQPMLLALRKRCPKQGSLPTIHEAMEEKAAAAAVVVAAAAVAVQRGGCGGAEGSRGHGVAAGAAASNGCSGTTPAAAIVTTAAVTAIATTAIATTATTAATSTEEPAWGGGSEEQGERGTAVR
ncbi:leucine-rich repeat-containing protein 75A-like [Lethenteron reissneri]|uniref:leucine-rich repeat-containing protein 75A-like n=1 Tax=Lethenteron reissneri TaxID=7753 RepID=UPI002AB722ED|nr:leucine-rich repeat-containing protein 75A-like [Lethenteron reissneri]XP_061417950.1 leucine-rich repeat-containing protein 75A-like [Lethenteron reissneri]